jgi:predicted dehydrogenase
VHKALMQTTSPIVDCGVHYVDVMCQITDAAPVEVRGMGLRLSPEIAETMYNYGHFQVIFADGSLGWWTSTSPATSRTPWPRCASASPRTKASARGVPSSSEETPWARST